LALPSSTCLPPSDPSDQSARPAGPDEQGTGQRCSHPPLLICPSMTAGPSCSTSTARGRTNDHHAASGQLLQITPIYYIHTTYISYIASHATSPHGAHCSSTDPAYVVWMYSNMITAAWKLRMRLSLSWFADRIRAIGATARMKGNRAPTKKALRVLG